MPTRLLSSKSPPVKKTRTKVTKPIIYSNNLTAVIPNTRDVSADAAARSEGAELSAADSISLDSLSCFYFVNNCNVTCVTEAGVHEGTGEVVHPMGELDTGVTVMSDDFICDSMTEYSCSPVPRHPMLGDGLGGAMSTFESVGDSSIISFCSNDSSSFTSIGCPPNALLPPLVGDEIKDPRDIVVPRANVGTVVSPLLLVGSTKGTSCPSLIGNDQSRVGIG